MLRILLISLVFMSVGCIKLPPGLRVYLSEDGCNTQGTCPWGGDEPRNWYDVENREIVISPNQTLKVLAHEGCHAHQHQVVIEAVGEARADSVTGFYDLREWLDTTEAKEYAATIAGLPPIQTHGIILLEDFAEACGRYLTGTELDEVRTSFFRERSFK